MTLERQELQRVIRRAARTAAYSWDGVVEADDIEQELWEWYLSRPSVQENLSTKTEDEAYSTFVWHANRVAADVHQSNLRFAADFEYSVDDARAVISGEDRRHESLDDLEYAMDALRAKNPDQAEILKAKFGLGEVMGTGARRMLLYRALENLTDLMNKSYRDKSARFVAEPGKTLGDGPGSRTAALMREPE